MLDVIQSFGYQLIPNRRLKKVDIYRLFEFGLLDTLTCMLACIRINECRRRKIDIFSSLRYIFCVLRICTRYSSYNLVHHEPYSSPKPPPWWRIHQIHWGLQDDQDGVWLMSNCIEFFHQATDGNCVFPFSHNSTFFFFFQLFTDDKLWIESPWFTSFCNSISSRNLT